MIELTEQQAQAVNGQGPIRVVDPRTNEAFILLRASEHEKLFDDEQYDDSPWTREKMEALAWEVSEMAEWPGMEVYDDYPETPGAETSSPSQLKVALGLP